MASKPNEERPRLARVARWLGLLGFAAFLAAALLVASAGRFWLGEIAASFAWYLGLAGLVGGPLLWLVGGRRLSLATLAIAALLLRTELVLYLPDERAGAEPNGGATPELTLATCNLLCTNPRLAAFDEWLAETETDPDVIVFQEVTPEWLEVLLAQRERYPFIQLSLELERWSKSTFAGALLSRLPLESSRSIPVSPPYLQGPVEAVVRLDGRAITIRGAHAPRPGRAWRTVRRNLFLDALSREPWNAACVLAGDLNTTSSSPAFGALLAATSLRDSRRGFGRQPTFPVNRLFPALSIAIDHVLVGDALRVLERRTSVIPGSDHRAVVARIALASD